MIEHASPPEVVITREARWFRAGPLPTSLEEWFTNGGALGRRERRVDYYDRVSAGFGVGLKQRNDHSLDAKFLLAYEDAVPLAPGITGRIEDWIKLSQPIAASVNPNGTYVEVKKDILTRLYTLGDDPSVGCEVELTGVEAGGRGAWTLCFETFGSSDLRQEALRAGVEAMLAETPLPASFELTAESSWGYPRWIDRRPAV